MSALAWAGIVVVGLVWPLAGLWAAWHWRAIARKRRNEGRR